ncbi:putative ATP citrate synthase [Rosa chinensis]|uniref:Putative ATP citrate synthase n=1 Tax=Rosa chinensis TaxID=74649 RepID=A0A2P6RRH9_ROSCH|nr:putative ATP citrate synthase [Rosa chinensis]
MIMRKGIWLTLLYLRFCLVTTFLEPWSVYFGKCCLMVLAFRGIDIEENWDKVKTIFVPTGASLSPDVSAPLVATLPLEEVIVGLHYGFPYIF